MVRKIGVLIITFWVLMSGSGMGETIDWKEYNDGIRLARKTEKKVFLHFRTDWCGYCAQMEKTTFKDNTVINFLNEHFVSIKVDGDREKSFTKAYKVTGFPDNRFLDEERKEVYRLPGFVESAAFAFFLEYIQTNSFKTMDPMQYYKTK